MAVHITAFDKEYPPEKQAEGLAMYQAVLGGHCLRCEYLIFCSDNESFQPPAFTWCARRRVEILKTIGGDKGEQHEKRGSNQIPE